MPAPRMRRLRRVALLGGLAVACALVSATPALAAWEAPRAIDNGSGYGAVSSIQTALATGPDGLATAIFFQTPSSPAGAAAVPFLVRRPATASAGWTPPAAVATPGGQVTGAPQPTLAATGAGALGNGGVWGLFGFQPSSGSAQLGSTAWSASASAPSPSSPVLCTSGATPECATSLSAPAPVAFDGAGNAYAVGSASNFDVLFARTDSNGNWQPAEIVAKSGEFPLLAVDPAGDVVVAYARQDNSTPGLYDYHEYAIRQRAGQGSFTTEQQVSGPNSTYANAGQSGLVMDQSGTATIVFVEDTVPPTPVAPSAPVVRAARWRLADAAPTTQQVSGTIQAQGQIADPSTTVDPQGNVTVAWDGTMPTGSSVYAAQLTGSSWGSPQQVSPAGRSASHPLLAADRLGTVTLVYTDETSTFSDVDVKARRLPLGGTWSDPVSLRSVDPSAGAVQTISARLAASAPGQADVIFVQQLGSVNRLLATRFDDTTPPSIEVVTPQEGATYSQGTTVLADYSCADEPGGSGLASCSGPVGAGQPIDTSHPGSNSFTVTAVDAAGNVATKTVDYTIRAGPPPSDTTPPQITLTLPADGAVYGQGQRVVASFSCSDPDSPVSSCRGTTPSGSAIDTRTLGEHSFSVIAQDPAGNTASKTVHYSVVAGPPRPPPPPSPPVRPRGLELTVAPRQIKTGQRVRLRFRVVSCASRRCRGVSGARVSFGQRNARTNRFGYATIVVTIHRPGRHRAYARAPGYKPATVTVTARPRRRARPPPRRGG